MVFLIPKEEKKEKKTQIYMCLATTPKKKNVLGPVPGTLIKII